MARRRRSLFVLPVIVFACSIVGGIYGPKLQVASAATPSEDLDADVRNFSKVLSLVEANFADQVEPAEHRAILADEHVENAGASLLLGQQGVVLLGEGAVELIAAAGAKAAEQRRKS